MLLGYYDTQYADRTRPDCRGRLRTNKDGYFAYRAIVPPPYPIPGDVSVSLPDLTSSTTVIEGTGW